MIELKNCKLGTVVKKESNDAEDWDIGHITGFDRNGSEEVVIRVQWSRHPQMSVIVHPGNIYLEY